MAAVPTQTAQLTYDAAQELLLVKIGNVPYFMKAYSGGSRGHKIHVTKKQAADYRHEQAGLLASHFTNTPRIQDQEGHYLQRGGTLPEGHYTCHYHKHYSHFGECIQLLRCADAKAIYSPFSPHPIPHHRGNDFFIHGSGPKGSDGCIVPANEAERYRLNQLVKNCSGKVILLVKNVSYLLPAELEGQNA